MIKSLSLWFVAALVALVGSVGVAAAAPLVDQAITVPLEELAPIVLLTALAVAAVVGIGDRHGRDRAWYITGLVAGVLIVWPIVGWPASLPVGLAASAVVVPAKAWIRARARAAPPDEGRRWRDEAQRVRAAVEDSRRLGEELARSRRPPSPEDRP